MSVMLSTIEKTNIIASTDAIMRLTLLLNFMYFASSYEFIVDLTYTFFKQKKNENAIIVITINQAFN